MVKPESILVFTVGHEEWTCIRMLCTSANHEGRCNAHNRPLLFNVNAFKIADKAVVPSWDGGGCSLTVCLRVACGHHRVVILNEGWIGENLKAAVRFAVVDATDNQVARSG